MSFRTAHSKYSNFIIRTLAIVSIGMIFLLISYDREHLLSRNFIPNLFSSKSGDKTYKVNCKIRGDKWIVITTIFYPTPAVKKFMNLTSLWNIIVIGDRKTPQDWLDREPINTARLWFLSINDQQRLGFKILNYLPEGSYARKNLGYLVALACGAEIIYETDDDNLLEGNDIPILPKRSQPVDIPWVAFRRQRSPFVNIYGSFGQPTVWPRGFPVDELKNVTEDGWHSVRRNEDGVISAYIQQYLADLDPDVDALYRLSYPLTVGRIKFDRSQAPIAIEPFTFSPYNTQNTITHYEAFWGLYLPITTTFRVCDIWRGLWVQRLLWDIGGQLVFGTATVEQVRNSHSYINDMDDEYQLYHQSGSFARFLANWSSSLGTLAERIEQLARDLSKAGLWNSKEVQILHAWLTDLRSVNYSFPLITVTATPPIKQKRAAVCVVGLMECVEEGWALTDESIRKHLQGEIDTFLFLSSSRVDGPVSLRDRMKQARSYKKTTATVLYEDRAINLQAILRCSNYSIPFINQTEIMNYYQKLWGLSKCFELVNEFQQKMNVRYNLLIRAQPDSVLKQSPFTWKLDNSSVIVLPTDHTSYGYNDRFAFGSMKSMEKYMRRWEYLRDCSTKKAHTEYSLEFTLERFSIGVKQESRLSLFDIPRGHDQCH